MSASSARPLSEDDTRDLLRVAHAAALLAYSPYSKVQIGAALMASDGEVFTGCSVENASYGLSLCAERVAVAKAVSAGVTRFRALAVATASADPVMPCGACRQVLREFGAELALFVQGSQGPRAELALSDLLPKPFTRGGDV